MLKTAWVKREGTNIKQGAHLWVTNLQPVQLTTQTVHVKLRITSLDSTSMMPHTIKPNNGSSMQSITTQRGDMQWMDNLGFYNQPVPTLQTYGIVAAMKGDPPHGRITTSIQNDVGPIPLN